MFNLIIYLILVLLYDYHYSLYVSTRRLIIGVSCIGCMFYCNLLLVPIDLDQKLI